MVGGVTTLHFARDLSFRLSATRDSADWLDELARVMQLDGRCSAADTAGRSRRSTPEPAAAGEQIVIARTEGFRCVVDEWRDGGREARVRRRGGVSFAADPERRITVCDLAAEQSRAAEYWKLGHALHPLYAAAHRCGGFLIHAALVERAGTGFLVSAPGGNGKTTLCRRFPPGWRPLADDLALVVPDSAGYVAHPLPTWSTLAAGDRCTVWASRLAVPLAALFFLEQSTRDEVVPLGPAEVAMLLCQSVGWFYAQGFDDETVAERGARNERIFDTACKIARRLPGFVLRASLDGTFWRPLEQALAECGSPPRGEG